MKGQEIEEDGQVGSKAVRFYTKQFKPKEVSTECSILNHIPKVIIVEENELLVQFLESQEIKDQCSI